MVVFRWVILAVTLVVSIAATADRQIVIYHTSDIHGAVYPHAARWFKPKPERAIGGFAALSKLLERERRPYALLDSGDIFQGTPEGNLTRGSIVVAAMNRLGYDAMAIGNHEFDYGEKNLRRLHREARFPFMASNILDAKSNKPVDYAVPRIMLHVGGVHIGVVGIATHTTRTSTLPKNVKHLVFENEVVAASKQADLLRAEGADIVVALTHCGLGPHHARTRLLGSDYQPNAVDLSYQGDLAIARGASVDLILGGHMHIGLDGGWRDPKSGTWIFESFERLEAVHQITVTVRDTPRGPIVTGIEGKLLNLWVDELGSDQGMVKLLASFSKDVDRRMNKVVGSAPQSLTREGLDSHLGNWLTDVMRKKANADLGLQNTYGIRSDLAAGAIRIRDLYEVMPFDNELVLVSLTGRQLQSLIRGSLLPGKTRLQISGARIHYRVSSSQEVIDLRIEVGGESLEPEKTYTIATNDYLTSGGSGSGALSTVPAKETGIALRQLFLGDVLKRKTVTRPELGRIVQLP